ncbi:hypothetical protein R1flu_019635 [Riccia fluitans]|uniref:Kinesin motor domain-containing protein n=1 Tax=Riccia fluitans TaxID=41844 RepID=A0ABD1ZJK4_9MARC
MAKGISPLRLFMRNNSKKTLTESSEGSSSTVPEPPVVSSTTPQRQPLCPIPESKRNPLTPPPAEKTFPDSAAATTTPKSKSDQSTPRARAKLTFGDNEKFPHLENSDGSVNMVRSAIDAHVSGTPEKNSQTNSRGKFTWHTHHSSNVGSGSRTSPAQARQRVQQENIPMEIVSELSTPQRGSKQSSADSSQVSTGVSHQNAPGSARAGNSQTTPKSSRNSRSGYDSESGLHQHGTPSKSVSRTLKYGQQQQQQQHSGSSSGAMTGLANVRSMGQQHILTRTMGILQSVKGPGCQANNTIVDQQYDLEEDPSFWTDHNVQVIIRTRPFNSSELAAQGTTRCLRQESPHTLTWLGQPESRYTFDHVAGENITQETLFKVAGLPMVENCMAGYNSCMFAYGQTGSGKTHTMLGDIDDLEHRPSDKRGMTPRVFEYLFSKIRMEQERRQSEQLKYFCKCSFLEIYNEQITDLLEPTSTNLQLREDAKKGVYVENLTEVEVKGVQDVIQLLLQGSANRKVASTNMNRESSRSHSVFTCIVESKWETNSMTNSRYGRLHLVDLAGSERQKTSGAEGGRLKEAANINKSLSTLGLVIMILVDVANGKQRHVPYRDSKLTFLLQDSLGGNSKTIMIANVSPSSCNAMETLSTLKFAQRAKFIRNNAVINEDASGDVMVLRQQIQELKVEVDRLRRESMSRTTSMKFGSSLHTGSMDVDNSGENVDSGTADSSHSPDSSHVKTKAYLLEKKLKGMEAVLAGSLRREQVAEDTTKKMAAEIDQLNRLVQQREEDSQCSKMMLRFREDKIGRLEGVADGLLSAELYYKEEHKALTEELLVIKSRLDRNPELTRFAMENIRLMEQLRSYQEFYDCGVKDVLLAEIAALRNQLLDILDEKLGEETGQLTTPQKRALAPEIAARVRENELLLIEVQGYQKEVKECRTNLNNCLVANAELTRQVDQMQAMITQLKDECVSKQQEVDALKIVREQERSSGTSNQEHSQRTIEELKAEIRKNEERWAAESEASIHVHEQLKTALQEAAHLRAELESSRKWSEDLASSQVMAERLHSTEANLAAAQETASTAQATVKQIRLETEEIAHQQRESLSSIQKEARNWRVQESELRAQLKSAQEEIDRLTTNLGRGAGVEDGVGKESGPDSLQKLQKVEKKFCEEISHLQLEVESVENALKKEQHQRLETEQKIEVLMKQLEEMSVKLEHERSISEAFEGQNLSSIYELEKVQAELARVSDQLRESESKGSVLQDELEELEKICSRTERRRNQSDASRHTLQLKLEKARKEREEIKAANEKYHAEKVSRLAQEKEIEVSRTQAESETALALTTMQEEIFELREEVAAATESETVAKLQVLQLKQELEEFVLRSEELKVENDTLVSGQEAELRHLRKQWEGATAKLIDYLVEGDEELIEAAKEMDDIVESSFSPRLVGAWKELDVMDHEGLAFSKKQKAFELLHQHLQEAQSLARETEESVRALGDNSSLRRNADEAIMTDIGKKTVAALVLVTHLTERMKELEAVNASLAEDKEVLCQSGLEKDNCIAALQKKVEDDQDSTTLRCQVLIENIDATSHELERALREADDWKFQTEQLELKVVGYSNMIRKVDGEIKKTEEQVLGLEATAVECLQRASNDVLCVYERVEMVQSLLDDLVGTLESISKVEGSIVGLESVAEVLLCEASKVKFVEESVVSYSSAVTSLRSKLSDATFMLEFKADECARLLQEKELKHNESVGQEELLASLHCEVQTLEASLEQAERKISEMSKALEALSVAKDELEIDRDRLIIASQEAAKNCAEKELACGQGQEEICLLQSKITEAEIREQSISMQLEELLAEKQTWESEKVITGQEIEELRVEKQRLELETTQMKSNLVEKELSIFRCLERIQMTLEAADLKLSLLDEDLSHLVENRASLERDVADLELTASSTVLGLQDKEKELNHFQLQLETVQSQMVDAQASAESLKAEIVNERSRWVGEMERVELEKESLELEYLASLAQLRKRISEAELKLLSSEEQLECITKKAEKLSAQKSQVELALVEVKEDAASAISNLTLREEELEELRAGSDRLKSRCDEAEGKVLALESLLQEYVLSGENWKSEKLQLVEKLKEVELMSASFDQSSQDEIVECHNLPGSDEVPHAHIRRLKFQVENLKRKVSEKDATILSAKKEMEVAIGNLKEAELEMDKLQAEKDALKKTCEASTNIISTTSLSLSRAEEEISRKQLEVEAFEKEMLRVGEIVDEWEVRMLDAEKVWKVEKEGLMKEVDSAKLEAREKGLEAAILNQKFQDTQVTLMEAESLVNLLVRANETAKHTARDFKSERDELRQSQQGWVPERDRLLAAINYLRMEMDERDQQLCFISEGTAAELTEILAIVSSVQEEIVLIRSENEEQLQSLSDEVKNMRNHLLQVTPVAKELVAEIDTLSAFYEQQNISLHMVKIENVSLSEQLQASKATIQLQLEEVERMKGRLSVSAVEKRKDVQDLEGKLVNAENEVRSLNESLKDLRFSKQADEEELKELRSVVSKSQANLIKLKEDLVNQENATSVQMRKLEESELTSGEMQTTIHNLHQIISQLTVDNNTAQDRLSELETQMANAGANIIHLMEELEEGRNEVEHLERKLSQLQSESRDQATSSKAHVVDLEAEVEKLKSQLHFLEDTLTLGETEMDDYLQASSAGIYELIVERDALQSYVDMQTESLSKWKKKMHLQEAQIRGLDEQISSMNVELATARKAVDARDPLIAELAQLRYQLQASNTDNGTLSEIVSGLQVEIIEAEAAISQLQTELEDCKLRLRDHEQAESRKDELTNELTSERNQLHDKLLRQIEAVRSMEQEAESLQSVIVEYQQRKVEHATEVEMTLGALDVGTVGASTGIANLRVTFSQLILDLEKERTAVRDLKNKLVCVENENNELICQLEAQLIAHSTALIGSEEEISVMKEDRRKLEASFAAQTSELQQSLEEERSRFTCLEEKVQIAEKEISLLKCNLDEKVQQLREEKDRFQVTAEKVKVQLEEGMRNCRDLEKKLAATEHENAAFLRTVEVNSDQVAQERDQLEILLSEQAASHSSLLEEIDSLKEERTRKEDELEELQSQMQSYLDELDMIRDVAARDAQLLSSHKTELGDLKQKCKSLVDENDELKCEVIALEGRVLDLEEEMGRKKKAVSELESKLKLEKEKTSEQNIVQSMEHQAIQTAMEKLESKEEELAHVNASLDLVLLENGDLKYRLTELEDRLLDLQEEIERTNIAKEESDENRVRQQTVLKREIDTLQHELVQQLNSQKQLREELQDVDIAREKLYTQNRLLTVYKHETQILQQTLTSTVELYEHLCTKSPDLSLIGQEVFSLRESIKGMELQRMSESVFSLRESVERMELQRMSEEMKEEIYSYQHTVAELLLRCSALEEELDDKRNHIGVLAHDFVLERENSLRAIQSLKDDIQVAQGERNKYQTDILVLTEQLEMAQNLADERESAAAEARQIAERSKSRAEENEKQAKVLASSVEELESTIFALESQLGVVKRDAEKLRRAKEDVESELGSIKQQMQLMQITIDHQDAKTARDFEDAKSAKTELDRMVIEMKNQQMQTRKTVESLQQECAEKDVQLRSCKTHIAELISNAEKQGSENQQKLKVLESMVEQVKMEERKVTSTVAVLSKSSDSKNTSNKAKGSGSPFKCMGSGLAQQRSSEIDEELSAARKRIRELEATAAARQKEVFMLNTKLAEAESMTHDVVRDLLGVKMDIASYATLLSQQKVQQIADKARRRTEEAHQKEEEIEKLRSRLYELITERESWLEEINRRQAESVAARVSAEKLRLRDSLLATENEKLKVEVSSLRKKVTDLEEEYRKLSGQQNLQQRIHHHAKIKEENNTLKSQNEDLSGKLRRTEILFTRVNDELARYRNAEGRSPFLNFDEEERLRRKLQETEENRMQLAQNFVSLCTAIITAAGLPRTSRDPDAATAMDALLQLQDRLEAMERELLDLKLKGRIANEKRRMSDLREQHTPKKNLSTNFTANQQITSPDSSSR